MHVSFSLCFDAFYVNYMRERRKDPLLQHAANLVSHLNYKEVDYMRDWVHKVRLGTQSKSNEYHLIQTVEHN